MNEPMLPSDLELLAGAPGETLSETLYRTLLEQIMFGQLANVSRLYPNELAGIFGVSPTPVREALSRLASEGYVELIPRHGYHVRKPSPQQLVDTWQVRQAIEMAAGEIIIDRLKHAHLTAADLNMLVAIQQRLDTESLDHRLHAELNSEFHRVLVDLSGNRMLSSIYDAVHLHVLRAWVQRGSEGWVERLPSEAVEHRQIITALQNADLPAFSKAVRWHMRRSLGDNLGELDGETSSRTPAQVRGGPG